MSVIVKSTKVMRMHKCTSSKQSCIKTKPATRDYLTAIAIALAFITLIHFATDVIRGERGCIRAVIFAVFLLVTCDFLCFMATLRSAVLVTFRGLEKGGLWGKESNTVVSCKYGMSLNEMRMSAIQSFYK